MKTLFKTTLLSLLLIPSLVLAEVDLTKAKHGDFFFRVWDQMTETHGQDIPDYGRALSYEDTLSVAAYSIGKCEMYRSVWIDDGGFGDLGSETLTKYFSRLSLLESAFDLTRSNYREEFKLGKKHASLDILKDGEANLFHLMECIRGFDNAASFLLRHPSQG